MIEKKLRRWLPMLLGTVMLAGMTVPLQAANPGYLRLPFMSEVPSLDPGVAQDTTSIEVIEQLFLGLTDYDPETFDVVPELATGWEASSDRKTYSFSMRRDVR